jgi:hypothetical protein
MSNVFSSSSTSSSSFSFFFIFFFFNPGGLSSFGLFPIWINYEIMNVTDTW